MVGVAVAVFGLVACGSGGSSGKPTPPTGRASTPSVAQLQVRLLTAADAGTAWKNGQPINAQDLAAFAQVPCRGTALAKPVATRLTAVTGVQFEPADRSYRHLIELVVTGAPAQLDRDLGQLFAAIESCSAKATTSPSAGHVSVKKLAVAALGDQRSAYSALEQLPSAATALSLRAGYVRVGATAVLLALADFQATKQGASKITDATFVQLLTSAVDKLRS
jgi:hypothetical protein